MSEEFLCPERPKGPHPFKLLGDNDHWRAMPDGSRTCSYCGSLHPADFLDIMQRYAAGEEGYSFGTTSKPYKAYGHRPGVKNASEGGIKFYGWHIPGDADAIDAHRTAFKAAHERQMAKFRQLYGDEA